MPIRSRQTSQHEGGDAVLIRPLQTRIVLGCVRMNSLVHSAVRPSGAVLAPSPLRDATGLHADGLQNFPLEDAGGPLVLARHVRTRRSHRGQTGDR